MVFGKDWIKLYRYFARSSVSLLALSVTLVTGGLTDELSVLVIGVYY